MFLHWWAVALGIAAVGLPVLIHWLTRPRPVRLSLSTLKFVREAVQQRRARHRLRDLLVLVLRTAAICLLAAAMARPFFGETQAQTVDESVDAVRVVIVDVSQSMATETNGVAAFERGRSLASEKLNYRSGLRVNLILAGARSRSVFRVPSNNFAALREEMVAAAPQPERLNVQAALNMAAEMLAASGGDEALRRELVVISDFQRSNWAAADFSTLPTETVIQLESVAPEKSPPNLAVLRVAGSKRIQAGREARLEVDVGNYSTAPRQVRVEVTLGNGVYRLDGNCAPLTKTTLSTEFVPRNPGWQVGRARLLNIEDALPVDDTRFCALAIRPPPVYALISQQDENHRPSSSYFLQRGLVPTEDGTTRDATRLQRMAPSLVDRESIGAAELLILDHPGKLTDETINLLASLLRRGRGILYVASDPIDALNLTRLTEAVGAGLQLPVEFAAPAAGRPRHDLFLTDINREQSPFAVFGDNLSSLTGPLRFSGGLASRRIEGALADDILATFSDQSAFLVSTSSEAGALAILNADLGRSNLAASPMFVPLLAELAQRLLGGDRQIAELFSGEPLAIYLPSEAGSALGLQISGPTEEAALGRLTEEPAGVLWRADAAGTPGVYQVQRGNETVFATATSIPPEESDPRSLSAEVFGDRLAGRRDVRFRTVVGASQNKQDTLWTWLAVACITCVMGEIVTLRMFRT